MYRAYRVHTEGVEKQSVTKQMTKQVSRALPSRIGLLAFEEKQEACRQDTEFDGMSSHFLRHWHQCVPENSNSRFS